MIGNAAIRHLIITGGTGYIGSRLVQRALADGRHVTLLGRRAGPAGARHLRWSLGEPLPAGALQADLSPAEQGLVHLAHDWSADQATSVAATGTLFDAACAAGVGARVLVSSQSARPEALNRYGRLKWATEQRVADAASLRVGLVYGGPRIAMYGRLCALAALPVLPMIQPRRPVQPIHLDEVVDGILAALDGRLSGALALAGPDPIAFGEVLRLIALRFQGRDLRIFPVPLAAALLACDVSARLPIIPTVDRERVLGFAGTEPIDSAADLETLGVRVRPMAEMLAQEPAGRRALLAEGLAFLRHVGIAPTGALLRRYARAVTGGAMARPRIALGWREPLGAAGALSKRMRVAARIAEASAPGEAMLAGGSRAGRLMRLAIAGMVEAVMLPTRWASGRR